MKFLIVDDEAPSMRKLERILTRLYPGAEVLAFDDAQEAAKHREADISVAFLDVEMPEMKGTELAEILQEVNPRLNVVFVTAYDDYAVTAYKMHASGYLMKPYSMEDILTEMEHLRYPVEEAPKEEEKKAVRIQCFGRFEIFMGDEPLRFERRTSKEILAYLIHLRGASATRMDISLALWEDSVEIERKKGYFRSLIASLRNTLKSYGIEDLLIVSRDNFAVNIKMMDCDLYRYLSGDKDPQVQFHGEYMTQYSWAEEMIGSLMDIKY